MKVSRQRIIGFLRRKQENIWQQHGQLTPMSSEHLGLIVQVNSRNEAILSALEVAPSSVPIRPGSALATIVAAPMIVATPMVPAVTMKAIELSGAAPMLPGMPGVAPIKPVPAVIIAAVESSGAAPMLPGMPGVAPIKPDATNGQRPRDAENPRVVPIKPSPVVMEADALNGKESKVPGNPGIVPIKPVPAVIIAAVESSGAAPMLLGTQGVVPIRPVLAVMPSSRNQTWASSAPSCLFITGTKYQETSHSVNISDKFLEVQFSNANKPDSISSRKLQFFIY
jgi:hypothetical protein